MEIKELDLEEYISWYINEFLKYFPDIYTYDELNVILHDRVKHIYLFDDRRISTDGEYFAGEKVINISCLHQEGILFHEFTHALRSYYYNDVYVYGDNGTKEVYKKFILADEGMTEYITSLYEIRKRRNNPNFIFFSLPMEGYHSSYALASGAYSMFNALTFLIEGKEFTKEYLKGANIYSYIYDIVLKYVCNFDTDLDNDDKEALAYRLSNIIVTYLADLGEEPTKDDAYDETLGEYKEIEKFIKNFLYSFNFEFRDKKKLLKYIGSCLLFERPITDEERLLSAIYDEPLDVYSVKDLENICTNFALNDIQRS